MKRCLVFAFLIAAPCMIQTRAETQAVERLTVAETLAEALQHNPDLATFAARHRQALAGADLREANRDPLVRLSGSIQQFTDDQRVRPASENNQLGVFADQLWRGDIEAGWTLYSGGGLTAAAEADRLLAVAAEKDVAFFRQQLATRLAQLSFELSARDALIAATDKSLQSLREQEKRVARMEELGKAAAVDRMRIQVQAASVEQRLIQQRNDRETLRASMNFLMGRPLDSQWTLDDSLPDLPNESPPSDTQNMEPLALRADLEALRIRGDSAARSVRAAQAAWRPELQAVGAWGPRGDVNGEKNYEAGFAGLVARWDMWDGGRRHYKVAQARAAEEVERSRYQSATENRQLEIITAQRNLQAALERLPVARLSTDTARETLRIEQSKYNEGKGTILDVLAADAAALESDYLLLRALADARISQAALDLALGTALTSAASCPCLVAPKESP